MKSAQQSAQQFDWLGALLHFAKQIQPTQFIFSQRPSSRRFNSPSRSAMPAQEVLAKASCLGFNRSKYASASPSLRALRVMVSYVLRPLPLTPLFSASTRSLDGAIGFFVLLALRYRGRQYRALTHRAAPASTGAVPSAPASQSLRSLTAEKPTSAVGQEPPIVVTFEF